MTRTLTEHPSVSASAVHDLRDDVVLLEFACARLPAVESFELLIFHGGNITPSHAAWRVRGTHTLLWVDRVAEA